MSGPSSPCLTLGPFEVIPEASMKPDLPGCDILLRMLSMAAGCSALRWALPEESLSTYLSHGTRLFEVSTLPVLWCMTRLSAAPGTLPLCLSQVA